MTRFLPMRGIVKVFCFSACIATAFAAELDKNLAKQIETRWCGQWDLIYSVCFTITQSENHYRAFYEWEEQQGGGFQKKVLQGKVRNANTIDFEGKIIIFNFKKTEEAIAVGLFEHHSRIALLKRVDS